MGHSTFNLGNADNMVFMESVYDFLNSLNWEAEIDQDTEWENDVFMYTLFSRKDWLKYIF